MPFLLMSCGCGCLTEIPKGNKGDTGATGATGANGSNGSNGSNGADGAFAGLAKSMTITNLGNTGGVINMNPRTGSWVYKYTSTGTQTLGVSSYDIRIDPGGSFTDGDFLQVIYAANFTYSGANIVSVCGIALTPYEAKYCEILFLCYYDSVAGWSVEKVIIHSDEDWHQINDAGEPAYASADITNYATRLAFLKEPSVTSTHSGMVRFRGGVTLDTPPAASTIVVSTLPAGYRPGVAMIFPVFMVDFGVGESIYFVQIDTSGVITASHAGTNFGNGDVLLLDGVQFLAEN